MLAIGIIRLRMPSIAGMPTVETSKITVAMTKEMLDALEAERKTRKIATVPEIVRILVSEYFRDKELRKSK